MGEDLESLNLKELQQLEQQLESSLKHIRSRKVVFFWIVESFYLNSRPLHTKCTEKKEQIITKKRSNIFSMFCFKLDWIEIIHACACLSYINIYPNVLVSLLLWNKCSFFSFLRKYMSKYFQHILEEQLPNINFLAHSGVQLPNMTD